MKIIASVLREEQLRRRAGEIMNQQWSLGIMSRNETENNLSLEDLAKKITKYLNSGINETDLLVWTSNWSEWKKFNEVDSICKEIERIKSQSKNETPPPLKKSVSIPPLPKSIPKSIPHLERHKNEEVKHSNFHKTNLKNMESSSNQSKKSENPFSASSNSGENNAVSNKPNQKRKHKRIFARFKCIIRSSTLTFRTFTQDISLGGLSLEDEIPSDLIGTECLIYINSTKTNKNLKFKIALTERCVAKYFSFQDADENFLNELSNWLDDHEKINAAS